MVLAAMAVLVVNDHVLKQAFPGWITGKLSDVVGLLFFPLLLQAGWEVARSRTGASWGPSRRVLVTAAIATGVVFSLVQVSPWGAEAYRWGLGALQWPMRALFAVASGVAAGPIRAVAVTPDPTDLITLPALLGALALGWRRTEPAPRPDTAT